MQLTYGERNPPTEVNVEFLQGFVRAGWAPIIERLVTDLEALGWDGKVYQVKEKFGGLRFYIGDGSEEIYKRIDQASDESFKTCEVCGTTEGVTTEGRWWIETLCPSCRKAD